MDKYIICHRGVYREKENTYESIIEIKNLEQNNIKLGVEFDIQIIQDGTLICYHDDTLERLHHNNKNVSELSYSDIKQLNIPTYDELLDGLSQISNRIFLVEIKVNKSYDENKIKLLCQNLIRKTKEKNMTHSCIFISFDDTAILELLKIDSNLKIGKLMSEWDFEKYQYFKSLGINYFIINKDFLIELINQHPDIIEKSQFLTYTLFNINGQGNKTDEIILYKIKNTNIGIITDNYKKVLSLLNI